MFKHTAEFYDAVYSFKNYDAEAEQIVGIIERNAMRPVESLLEAACGTGLYLQHLRSHYSVEGLDLDEGMLAVARERLPDIPLHHADMTAFDLGRRFDAVICMFSSIGYVRTLDRLDAAIDAMAAHLEPGGVMLVEQWIEPDQVRPGSCGVMTASAGENRPIVRMNTSRVDGRNMTLEFHYLIGRPEGVEHVIESHEVGLFTRGEQVEAMERAGVDCVEVVEEGFTRRGVLVGRKR